MEQGETQGSGDGATPLVDATAKPLKELVYEEKKPLPPLASTPMQQGSWCKTEEEEKKEEERSVDLFMQSAMQGESDDCVNLMIDSCFPLSRISPLGISVPSISYPH